MLDRAAWAALLARTNSVAALAQMAAALGFGPPAPLNDDTRTALGIPDGLDGVQVAAGIGTTRALLVVTRDNAGIREQLMRLASRMAARAPHLLWLVLMTSRRGECAIASWTTERRPPRVAALTVDCARVISSDVDTLCALAAARDGNDLMRHARWQEVLGREALSRRFYVALELVVLKMARHAEGSAGEEDRREVALLNVSRLLFLAFLETKEWLDGDRGFLNRAFDDCMRSGGNFHRRVCLPLFFGTLNTPPKRRAAAARAFGRIPFLNGGLFHRSACETRARRLVIRDEEWARLYDELLQRYRFTTREESGEWVEAAVDPEMLGRAFESLMASRERRSTGAFFTPQPLVERIVDAALVAALSARGVGESLFARAVTGSALSPEDCVRLAAATRSLRVLDPACGSGAFLVHALERLTTLYRAAGDPQSPSALRRQLLTENIFGVDVNPTAVWLCELRLWLSVVVEQRETDPLRVTPLPNLDHNVRCGDALAGGDFSNANGSRTGVRLAGLRRRYARSNGARKRSLRRELDREERREAAAWLEGELAKLGAERRSLLVAARGRDLFGGRRGVAGPEREALASLRARSREVRGRLRALAAGGAVPFAFAAHFSDVAASGGFEVVLGNPPWVRVHRVAPGMRERFRREFAVYRDCAWEAGARDARAGHGFAAQIDLASLFVERGMALTRPGGAMALLVPVKLWRSLAGGGVRRLVFERHEPCALEDWSEAPSAFDAAVYPALIVARRRADKSASSAEAPLRVTTHRGALSVSWSAVRRSVAFDDTLGAPWLLLPPEARAGFDRLTRSGVALVRAGVGQPTLGVKCGCNEAFLVRETGRRSGVAEITSGDRAGEIEATVLRPVLRGQFIRAWRTPACDERIVYPHMDDGAPLHALPPLARAWLLPWRPRLLQRTDARGRGAWWRLFRVEAALCDRPRVVWADLARVPRAAVLPAGDRSLPINTCYVLRCRDLEDAFTLAALLNSPVAAAWLAALAEPARGGYRRYLAWTVARLPVPDDWARARLILTPLGERGYAGAPPSRGDLLDAVLEAYRLRPRAVAPLLEWTFD